MFYEGIPEATTVQTSYHTVPPDVGFDRIETGPGRRGRFRPCLHVSKRVHYLDTSIVGVGFIPLEEEAPYDINDVTMAGSLGHYSGISTAYSKDWVKVAVMNYHLGFDPEPLPEIGSGEIDRLAVDAWRKILQRIKPTDASIVNFLLELEDLKQVLGPLLAAIKATDKRDFNAARATAQLLAGGYLAFEFGLKPFLIDTGRLAQTLQRVEARLQQINAEISKETTEHYRVTIEGPPSERKLKVAESLYGSFGYHHYRLWRQDVVMPAEFTFTLKFKFQWKSLSSARRLVDFVLGSLGVANPLAIAWEAIPYSFLVDYFIGIGDLIDGAFKGDVEPYHVIVTDACYSLKQEIRSQYDLFYDTTLHEAPVVISTRRYERIVGLPPTLLSIPRPRLPSLYQLSIMTALTATLLLQKAIPPKWKKAVRWLNFGATEKPYYHYGPGNSRNNPFFKKPRRYRYR